MLRSRAVHHTGDANSYGGGSYGGRAYDAIKMIS